MLTTLLSYRLERGYEWLTNDKLYWYRTLQLSLLDQSYDIMLLTYSSSSGIFKVKCRGNTLCEYDCWTLRLLEHVFVSVIGSA